MNKIIINNKEYISSKFLFENAPIYCKMSRTSRDLIKKKKITHYIFAKLINKIWTESDGKSFKFDKVFFNKSFIDAISEINEEKIILAHIEIPPDIIHLDNNEKFKDENDNIIEIETRCDKTNNKVYFKLKDIMIGFKITNLLTTIINKIKNGYIDELYYKYFYFTQKYKIKKEIYLTYEGLLNILFTSRSYNVKPFINCATDKLFILQMGSIEKKEELISSVLGINAKMIQPNVKRKYEISNKSYIDQISNLINKIKELENKNDKQLLKHELELQKYKYALELQNNKYELNLQNEKYEDDILIKNIEIINLQMKLNR